MSPKVEVVRLIQSLPENDLHQEFRLYDIGIMRVNKR
jgi:hypothetical protein